MHPRSRRTSIGSIIGVAGWLQLAPPSHLLSRINGVHFGQRLAVFSLSNERAGPKDRKYDPSRSHYKKVSLLRDRLIPAVGTTPTIIFIPPPWRGPLGSRRPKKAIAFSGGCFLVGVPFGPRGSVAWVPALGLSAVVGSCLLRTYHTSTTTQQHNPYSNSVFDINPISPTLHSNFSSERRRQRRRQRRERQ